MESERLGRRVGIGCTNRSRNFCVLSVRYLQTPGDIAPDSNRLDPPMHVFDHSGKFLVTRPVRDGSVEFDIEAMEGDLRALLHILARRLDQSVHLNQCTTGLGCKSHCGNLKDYSKVVEVRHLTSVERGDDRASAWRHLDQTFSFQST